MPLPVLRARAPRSFDDWLLLELARARERLVELRRAHPSAADADLARRLIDGKKVQAARGGVVTGFFGLAAVPADVALLAYLQLTLAIELAVLYGVNIKAAGGRRQLYDVLGWEEDGLRLRLLVPSLAARASRAILRRSAWGAIGRAVPVFAAPIAAWLNHRELQRLGDSAMLAFGAFRRLHAPVVPVDVK